MSTIVRSTVTSSGSAASSAPSTTSSTGSRPSMASDTSSARNDEGDLVLTWSGRWTLTHRILAVNVLTLAIFALSILYLDSYRNRITEERLDRLESETAI